MGQSPSRDSRQKTKTVSSKGHRKNDSELNRSRSMDALKARDIDMRMNATDNSHLKQLESKSVQTDELLNPIDSPVTPWSAPPVVSDVPTMEPSNYTKTPARKIQRSESTFLPIMIDGQSYKPRGSLASRRSTALPPKLGQSVPSSLKLQPPKLSLSNISNSNIASPISASSLPGATIAEFASKLDVSLLPLWLQELLKLESQLPLRLNEIFSEIDKGESFRLRRTSPTSKTFNTIHANKEYNLKKNRYADIVPFDRNRVVLKAIEDKGNYINASYIHGPYDMKNYIVTQGPLPLTANHFWQMIWEQNSRIIVMLTLEEEKGKLKCHKYWPAMGDVLRIPYLEDLTIIANTKENILQDDSAIRRTFIMKQKNEERTITHIQFLGWPDHHVTNHSIVLELIDHVNRLQKHESQSSNESLNTENGSSQEIGPIVIHCSAGVGRTGTYCTVDSVTGLLEDGLAGGSQDFIKTCVDSFREQRISMVQTLEQYAFCYEAVLHWIHDYLLIRKLSPKWLDFDDENQALESPIIHTNE